MARKVCIVGSGNWGSAIARIVGETVLEHQQDFQKDVVMWVFEEKVDGRNLSEIINETHENTKYLPGYKLPANIIANPDLANSVKDADVLIHVVPHQFVAGICRQIQAHIKPSAINISLIKGLSEKDDGKIELISEMIQKGLGRPCHVLMGANLAGEVASGKFCEATVGAKNAEEGAVLKRLFHSPNFRISTVEDAHTVELCGALKNIVACGAGFTDGLGQGDNTKAAVIRLGLMEIIKFIQKFYPSSQLSTFFESCGVADLITTCFGGRNRKVCEAFVTSGKTMEVLEAELLGGQRLQGPHTAELVFRMIDEAKIHDEFPLFVSIHRICIGQMKASEMVDCLRNHPEHF